MKNVLSALLAAIVFCSCQKEYEVPDLVLIGPTAGMPTAYKLVSADDPGKAYYTKFFYDADQRVSKVVSVEYDSTVSPVKRDTFMVETFIYSGSNLVPSKLVTGYYTNNDTTYFQYDNGGRLIRDSTVSLGQTVNTRQLTYTGTGFTVLVKESGSPDLADSMVIASDNMTFLRRTVVGYPQYTQNVQMGYDVTENPLYAQNIRSVRFHMDLTEIGWPFYSSKFALKTFNQTGVQSGSFNVTNAVNSSGKLSKQTVVQNGQFLLEISYEY